MKVQCRALMAAVLGTMLFTTAGAAVIEEIAAWVNGAIITRSQVLDREEAMVTQFSARYVGDELDSEIERMRGALLTDMIREEMLLQRAEILGLELDKVFEQALENLKQQQGIKTNDELDAVLKQEGLTRDELRETLLRFNVPDIMINLEVRDKIVVTDEDVEKYFKRNESEFRSEEEFSIREIVVQYSEHSAEEFKEILAKVKDEVGLGVPFSEMVVKYSEAPSRFNEGLIGQLHRGDLMRELEAAALSLEVGGVSDVIMTPAGFHVVMLESHTLPEEPDLEEARSSIVAKLKKEKFAEALLDYFDMLFETNRIEVNQLYKKYDQRS